MSTSNQYAKSAGRWRYLPPSISTSKISKWLRADGAQVRRDNATQWIAVLPNGVSLKMSDHNPPVPRRFNTAKKAMHAMDVAKPVPEPPAGKAVI